MKLTDKGYKLPETGDADFWDQISYDIQRTNDHTHDGLDSQKLNPGAVQPYSVTVHVADWVGGSAPYYYDFLFPIGWNMTWADGASCPVQIVVRDSAYNRVFLDTARTPGKDGVRVYTSVKADYVVGMY